MEQAIDHNSLYRLPWNYADNAISWLEPTSACNLRCEGCYRDTSRPQHKTLAQIEAEMNTFKRLRKSDCMSITGGDPLVHPQITEIVKMAREKGWKPIINTNGVALKQTLLERLKRAGAFGFTFHIDTSQKRPRVRAKTEADLNDVR
ncbi:MAG: radical SAM protein, partial [Calditrichaeota bacterium]